MIILDTHVWIWWAIQSTHLSKPAVAALRRAERVGVSVISCWEIGMLVAKGRLDLDRDPLAWIRRALQLPKIELVPMSPEIALSSSTLPAEFHGDSADRIIVASARLLSSPLLTRDQHIREWGHVRAIW